MDSTIIARLDTFFSQFTKQSYKKGQLLIRAGESPSGIFYLTKGMVKMYAISTKGDEVVVNIFKEHTFFPMSWAINGEENKYFFEAMIPSEAYKTPKDKTIDFIKSNPDILFDLLSRVYKGTNGLLERMVYLMSGNAYTKLVIELLLYARRFGKKNGNEVSFATHEKDLATHAGITRETVSREMKLLKDKKLLSFQNNLVTIYNTQKLEEELLTAL